MDLSEPWQFSFKLYEFTLERKALQTCYEKLRCIGIVREIVSMVCYNLNAAKGSARMIFNSHVMPMLVIK